MHFYFCVLSCYIWNYLSLHKCIYLSQCGHIDTGIVDNFCSDVKHLPMNMHAKLQIPNILELKHEGKKFVPTSVTTLAQKTTTHGQTLDTTCEQTYTSKFLSHVIKCTSTVCYWPRLCRLGYHSWPLTGYHLWTDIHNWTCNTLQHIFMYCISLTTLAQTWKPLMATHWVPPVNRHAQLNC